MEIKHPSANLNDILRFWVEKYELPKNTHLHRWDWAWNPSTNEVMFRLFIADGPDPLDRCLT